MRNRSSRRVKETSIESSPARDHDVSGDDVDEVDDSADGDFDPVEFAHGVTAKMAKEEEAMASERSRGARKRPRPTAESVGVVTTVVPASDVFRSADRSLSS